MWQAFSVHWEYKDEWNTVPPLWDARGGRRQSHIMLQDAQAGVGM